MAVRTKTLALFAAGGLVASAASLLAAGPSGADAARFPPPYKVGLGKVVSTKDGGQIFGWDINQHGTDGVLASSQDTADPGVYRVSVETFDQATGKIVRSFARTTNERDSYSVDGIFADDLGLVTHYVVPKGSIYAKRRYDVMNPVTADEFTGSWTPPIRDVDIVGNAENQETSTSVVLTIELKQQDLPDLVVSDLGAGESHVIHLDPNLFGLANGPRLAQDTSRNLAMVAFSPDGGAVFGLPPRNALVNLETGHITTFNGLNNGFFHAGYVNGLAVDSRTRIAATTTELNAQVEFYDLKHRTGVFAQLPGTGDTDQLNSGAAHSERPCPWAVPRRRSDLRANGRQRDRRLRREGQAGRVDPWLPLLQRFGGDPGPGGRQPQSADGLGGRTGDQPDPAVLLLSRTAVAERAGRSTTYAASRAGPADPGLLMEIEGWYLFPPAVDSSQGA